MTRKLNRYKNVRPSKTGSNTERTAKYNGRPAAPLPNGSSWHRPPIGCFHHDRPPMSPESPGPPSTAGAIPTPNSPKPGSNLVTSPWRTSKSQAYKRAIQGNDRLLMFLLKSHMPLTYNKRQQPVLPDSGNSQGISFTDIAERLRQCS